MFKNKDHQNVKPGICFARNDDDQAQWKVFAQLFNSSAQNAHLDPKRNRQPQLMSVVFNFW